MASENDAKKEERTEEKHPAAETRKPAPDLEVSPAAAARVKAGRAMPSDDGGE